MWPVGPKCYEAQIVIDRPCADVWKSLSALEKWPQWTPTMTSVRRLSGEGVGAVYEVRQPGLPKSHLTISEWNEGHSFTWGATEKPSSMVAEHVLTEINENETEVKLTISMTGPMVALVWKLWGRKIRRFVDVEAQSLKSIVESRTA